MDPLLIILILVVIIGFMIVMIYNRLIGLRQTRKNAFADIDVQLRQRYDLVPQLLETVKGYASHEKELLENVTKARAAVGKTDGAGSDRIEAESMLSSMLGKLFAVSENYPDLKADSNFNKLMDELSVIEDKIAAARRFFNNATSEYNTAVQQFPANLIAGPFGFTTEEEFLEFDAATTEAMQEAPDVKFGS